jgi:hypothetical protein
MGVQVFEIPSSAGNPWLCGVLFLPAVVLTALGLLFCFRPLTIEVRSDVLTIRGSLYGRGVPLEDMLLDRARIVDLGTAPDLVPRWRTNGVGLPGYRVGWFRLENGEKALCFLTRSDSILYVPTKRSFALLLSVASPSELLRALQAAPTS